MLDDPVRRDIDRHEHQLQSLQQSKADVAILDALERRLVGNIMELTNEVRSLRRVIVGFAFTVAASSIGVVAAVLASSGG